MRGRAKLKGYVPSRPKYTVEERLDECLRIAELIEFNRATPRDELALQVHLKALKEEMPGV